MTRLRFKVLTLTLCALILSACNTNTDTTLVTSISLDFPYGGLRLLVKRDDNARLFYGALPTHRLVQSNTFNIDDLFQQLQPRLHENVPAERRPIGQSFGMVTIDFSDGSEQDYLIYDEAFAVTLFRDACANLVEDENNNAEVVTTECTRIGGTMP